MAGTKKVVAFFSLIAYCTACLYGELILYASDILKNSRLLTYLLIAVTSQITYFSIYCLVHYGPNKNKNIILKKQN